LVFAAMLLTACADGVSAAQAGARASTVAVVAKAEVKIQRLFIEVSPSNGYVWLLSYLQI
jgi:hypothetical protein